jgi:hypothetical protein
MHVSRAPRGYNAARGGVFDYWMVPEPAGDDAWTALRSLVTP